MNRVSFVNQLGSKWLPAISDVHARLTADPPARVADVGCGTGWSTIELARAYPKIHVDGIDLDEASINAAHENLLGSGLEDRATFAVRDAADPGLAGRYDLVTIFEALHDMSRPVEALRAARNLLADGGSVLIADERAAEVFTAPGDDLEQLLYGWSVLHCLPVGLAEQPSVGTGTAMRPATLRRYANEAGFPHVDVLEVEADFWRFYRLCGLDASMIGRPSGRRVNRATRPRRRSQRPAPTGRAAHREAGRRAKTARRSARRIPRASGAS